MRNTIQKNRGYTLLFAVLVSSIVLSVGISILTISKKEFQLSASVRDSAAAFNIADSGLECAAFYNNSSDVFSTSSPQLSSILCEGFNPPTSRFSETGGSLPGSKRYIAEIPFGSTGACVVVTVDRYYDSEGLRTKILSRGYNIGWNTTTDTCSDQSPRRVERALQLTY